MPAAGAETLILNVRPIVRPSENEAVGAGCEVNVSH